jgi:ubiquinone/menaquinone biosynthesis C-methylase UbiE
VPAPISFDPVAADYDATRGGEERGAHFAAAIHPWLVDGPVVEVGVGTGLVAMGLADLGVPVVGVDISASMLLRAYARLGPRLARADARHLPVRDASVATVVFPISLHVVGGIPAAFAEAARVVRPAGRVVAVHDRPVVEETDIDEPMRGLEARRASMGRIDTAEALAEAAEAAGLQPVHQGWTDPQARTITPNEMADGVERRLWSYLWDVDDETWQREVTPVITELRALPEPDRARRPTMRHRLSVFARPT